MSPREAASDHNSVFLEEATMFLSHDRPRRNGEIVSRGIAPGRGCCLPSYLPRLLAVTLYRCVMSIYGNVAKKMKTRSGPE